MYCRNCGKEIADSAAFCNYCGTPVASTQVPPAQRAQAYTATPAGGEETNTLAIVGFILSFFVLIAGLVCSILGYKNADKFGGKGKELAVAGIVISAVFMGLAVLTSIIYLVLWLCAVI